MTDVDGVVPLSLGILSLVLVLSSPPHAAAARSPANTTAAAVCLVMLMGAPSGRVAEQGLSGAERGLNVQAGFRGPAATSSSWARMTRHEGPARRRRQEDRHHGQARSRG